MTDQTPESGAETPAETTTGAAEGKDTGGNREARYRVERNEARAQVENLTQRISTLQRAEIERLASAGLSHPNDLFSLSGNELADYLTEDGSVDTEKVSADVASILEERPGLRKAVPATDPTQGLGTGQRGRTELKWSDLLKS